MAAARLARALLGGVLVAAFTTPAVASADAVAPRSVSATAFAPWASDPALEAAELIRQAHGNATLLAFWRAWASGLTDQSGGLRRSLALAEPLLPSLAYRALRIMLAARVQAPLVEMWREVSASASAALGADEGDACWAIACGVLHESVPAAMRATAQAGCDEDSAAASADHAVLGPLPSADHVLASTRGVWLGRAPSAVLVYADVHASGFGACLEEMVAAPHVHYPYPYPTPTPTPHPHPDH